MQIRVFPSCLSGKILIEDHSVERCSHSFLGKVRFMKIKNEHYVSESNDDIFYGSFLIDSELPLTRTVMTVLVSVI